VELVLCSRNYWCVVRRRETSRESIPDAMSLGGNNARKEVGDHWSAL